MTLQDAFLGLEDYNFVLLSEALQERKLRLTAVDAKVYRGGYQCRLFALNALAVEASPNASESFGGYNDEITISARGVLEFNRDLDAHGNPNDEHGFCVRISLDPDDPGRLARVVFDRYPEDGEGELDKKLLGLEWDRAAWEGLNFPGA